MRALNTLWTSSGAKAKGAGPEQRSQLGDVGRGAERDHQLDARLGARQVAARRSRPARAASARRPRSRRRERRGPRRSATPARRARARRGRRARRAWRRAARCRSRWPRARGRARRARARRGGARRPRRRPSCAGPPRAPGARAARRRRAERRPVEDDAGRGRATPSGPCGLRNASRLCVCHLVASAAAWTSSPTAIRTPRPRGSGMDGRAHRGHAGWRARPSPAPRPCAWRRRRPPAWGCRASGRAGTPSPRGCRCRG